MLEVTGLRAFYNGIEALKGVSLKVPLGAIITIIGTNGAGKSTLLKAISGLVRSKQGRILFEGRDITRLPPGQIVRLGLSLVPEGRQIFSHLSVEDNIDLGAYHYHGRESRAIIHDVKEQIFSRFPILKERLTQISGTLSGGEQQMLAIARAMMARPRLLLLDEPSMGLAPLFVQEIFRVLEQLNREGTTILLVEQNARAALRLGHYAYVLETGAVALEGEPARIMADEEIQKAYLGR
jgi:branched-chain amino acid transport system ATP-binding protein